MKWHVYLYTYNPVSIVRVAVIKAKDGMEALQRAHQHPRVKARDYDGMEVRRADRPLNIKEIVEAEQIKRRGEGRAWQTTGFKVGRPSKKVREGLASLERDREEHEDGDFDTPRDAVIDDLWVEYTDGRHIQPSSHFSA